MSEETMDSEEDVLQLLINCDEDEFDIDSEIENELLRDEEEPRPKKARTSMATLPEEPIFAASKPPSGGVSSNQDKPTEKMIDSLYECPLPSPKQQHLETKKIDLTPDDHEESNRRTNAALRPFESRKRKLDSPFPEPNVIPKNNSNSNNNHNNNNGRKKRGNSFSNNMRRGVQNKNIRLFPMNQHKKHQQQIRPNMVPKINAPLFPTPVSAVTSPFNNLPPWNHQANSSFNNFPATPFAQMPFSNNESTNIPTFQNVNILTDNLSFHHSNYNQFGLPQPAQQAQIGFQHQQSNLVNGMSMPLLSTPSSFFGNSQQQHLIPQVPRVTNHDMYQNNSYMANTSIAQQIKPPLLQLPPNVNPSNLTMINTDAKPQMPTPSLVQSPLVPVANMSRNSPRHNLRQQSPQKWDNRSAKPSTREVKIVQGNSNAELNQIPPIESNALRVLSSNTHNGNQKQIVAKQQQQQTKAAEVKNVENIKSELGIDEAYLKAMDQLKQKREQLAKLKEEKRLMQSKALKSANMAPKRVVPEEKTLIVKPSPLMQSQAKPLKVNNIVLAPRIPQVPPTVRKVMNASRTKLINFPIKTPAKTAPIIREVFLNKMPLTGLNSNLQTPVTTIETKLEVTNPPEPVMTASKVSPQANQSTGGVIVKVSGIGANIRESAIRRLARPCGMVESIDFVSQPSGKRFALVKFQQATQAVKFVQDCQGQQIDSCTLTLSFNCDMSSDAHH